MMKGHRILLVLLAAMATAPGTLRAAETTRALASDGSVLILETGALATFLDSPPGSGTLPVLALGQRTAEDTAYELVPSTDDAAEESAPLLLHDPRTDRATILWESRSADRTRVRLAERAADGTWSPVETLVDLEGADRIVFRALSTHGLVLTLPDSRTARARRELVHLLWWHEEHLRYTAVIFAGGVHAALPDDADLSAAIDDDSISPTVPSAALRASVSIAGLASGALQASFIDPASDRLITVEVAVGHLETALFVDALVDQLLGILDPSAPLTDGLRAEMIATGLRAEMIATGLRVNMDDALLDFLASTAESFTAGFFDLNPTATADQWVSALSALLGDLLESIYLTAGTAAGPLAIDLGAGQQVRVEQVFAHPAPITGEGPTRVYAPAGGGFAVVGWYLLASETVHWVESTDDPDAPWTEPREISISRELGIVRANALLQQRVE